MAFMQEEIDFYKEKFKQLKFKVIHEPELPGDMPDEMYDAIKELVENDDREGLTEVFRVVVRSTKQNILSGIDA